MTDVLRADVLLAIAAMTAVTVAMRLGGFFLMGYVAVTPRIRRMLDALPGSVIAAAVLPVIAHGGAVAPLAVVAAIAAMLATRNDLVAVAAGVVVAALARLGGLPG
jgi:uncharacterized membrane protein